MKMMVKSQKLLRIRNKRKLWRVIVGYILKEIKETVSDLPNTFVVIDSRRGIKIQTFIAAKRVRKLWRAVFT